jgi:hypothetical protein
MSSDTPSVDSSQPADSDAAEGGNQRRSKQAARKDPHRGL